MTRRRPSVWVDEETGETYEARRRGRGWVWSPGQVLAAVILALILLMLVGVVRCEARVEPATLHFPHAFA